MKIFQNPLLRFVFLEDCSFISLGATNKKFFLVNQTCNHKLKHHEAVKNTSNRFPGKSE